MVIDENRKIEVQLIRSLQFLSACVYARYPQYRNLWQSSWKHALSRQQPHLRQEPLICISSLQIIKHSLFYPPALLILFVISASRPSIHELTCTSLPLRCIPFLR